MTATSEAEAAPERVEGERSRWSRPWPPAAWPWALLAVVLVPIVVAGIRTAAGDWVPVGDSAVIAVRAQDVFSSHPPLLGMWASTSWAAGMNMNHPGPLLFDALAVPVALFGNAAGTALGMALINVTAVVGLFIVCRRRGGGVVATLALAVAALLCWSFGSAVLVEPWHATAVLLPFLLLAALCWSLADGDLLCLPIAVLVGSFVLQANLSYGVLVPAVLVWGCAGYVLGGHLRRARARVRARVRIVTAAAVVIALVCWAQPLAEQLGGDGQGNLTRLGEGLTHDQFTVDWATALRSVAAVVALPPWWFRPSYGHDFAFGAFGNHLPGLAVSVLGLLAVTCLLAACVVDARRRGDGTGATAAGTALVLLAASVLSANQTPTSAAGVVAYQMRFLWPVGAFVTLAVAVVAARRWAPSPSPSPSASRPRVVVAGAAVVAVVASVANLPASHQSTTAAKATGPVAATVVGRVTRLDLPPKVRVQCREGTFDPYCEAVMAGLADRGVELELVEEQGLRQWGGARRWDGDPATPVLTVMAGELAVFGPPGSDQVILHEALDRDEADELASLRDDAARALSDGDLRLNERGRRLAGEGEFDSVEGSGADPGDVDGQRAVELRRRPFGYDRHDLEVMAAYDLLDVDEAWARRLDRYLVLQRRVNDETVAVYLGGDVPV